MNRGSISSGTPGLFVGSMRNTPFVVKINVIFLKVISNTAVSVFWRDRRIRFDSDWLNSYFQK
uniref:PC62L n=1 Tax=African swine fever virus TaxID=10497 RepID=A0A6G7KU84_ASF